MATQVINVTVERANYMKEVRDRVTAMPGYVLGSVKGAENVQAVLVMGSIKRLYCTTHERIFLPGLLCPDCALEELPKS